MVNLPALPRRVAATFGAFLLVVGSVVPALMVADHADAAVLSSRKITVGSSKVSQTDVNYILQFNAGSSTSIGGIVIDFCSNSPLIGLACTAPAGFSTNEGGLAIGAQTINGSAPSGANFTVNAATTANTLVLTSTSANAVTAGQTVSITLGSSGGADGITNPSALGTFYARILTYDTNTEADGYVDTTPDVDGVHIDDGGVALSTANQLTTNARIQEQLQFCVGGTTVNDGITSLSTDCSVAFTGAGTCGNAVDLGVVDNANSYVSPVSAAAAGGNNCNGAAMVRTNASNGVVISYYPEADLAGTNQTRSLRVAGSTCSAGLVNTDRCFNSVGSTQDTIVAGAEEFGMTAAAVNPASTTSYSCTFAGGTCNLVRDANYDGTGANTYPTDTGLVAGTTNAGYAWDDSGTADTIASSSTVVDDEALILKFAATANITTPTGSYGVTSTYIATATF